MTVTLFLHAVTRDRHDFDAFAATLADRDTRAINLIGHGSAARHPRYTAHDYASAIDLPPRTVLYGHSLGGVIALVLAAAHPERVAGLVVEDPPLFEVTLARLAEGPFVRGFNILRRQKRDRDGPADAAAWEEIVASWSGARRGQTLADEGSDAVARRARQLAAFDPAVLDPLLDGTFASAEAVEAALGALRCPMICLAGERTLGSALTEADCATLDAYPHITVRRVPDAGHYLHDAAPDACREALAAITSSAVRS